MMHVITLSCRAVCAVSACTQQTVNKRLRGGEEKWPALFCRKYANKIHLGFICQMFALSSEVTFDVFFFPFLWGEIFCIVLLLQGFWLPLTWSDFFVHFLNLCENANLNLVHVICRIPNISCQALKITAVSSSGPETLILYYTPSLSC